MVAVGVSPAAPLFNVEEICHIFAISSCHPDIIMSVNSVGTMREDFPPGHIGISKDIIDLTQIPWTFYDDKVHHSDRTSIFDINAVDYCYNIIDATQGYVVRDLIVAQCIGPQFETPSEIDVERGVFTRMRSNSEAAPTSEEQAAATS